MASLSAFGFFQNGEELLRLGDHAITVRALAGQVDPGICQGDVDVVPWAGLAVAVPVLIGPHRGFFGTLGCEQLPHGAAVSGRM